MDIEALKRNAKDITSFSAKALLAYELTQVGGQVNSLQAADISTPQEVIQFSQHEVLQSSEPIVFNAQFLDIPAFNATDPSTDAEQIAAQDTLSAWVKISEQAASDSGFLPTDFVSTVKAVIQNGKTYNVSETTLQNDVEVTFQDSAATVKKNSLLVPYLLNNTLAIAIMADTDGEGVETTVGSYIATIGDKSIAIPARFDKDHNPISFMEFVTDANGNPEPREVSVSPAIINSDQSNIRDVQDPSVVIGKVDKGTEVILVGTDAEAQAVDGKNFSVLLAVTPEGKTFKIATSLVKRVDRKVISAPEVNNNPLESTIIPGQTLGEQDLTNPEIVAAMEQTDAFTNFYWTMYKEANMTDGIRLLNLKTPENPEFKKVTYEGFTANYITMRNPIIDPETKQQSGESSVDVILSIYDPENKSCSTPGYLVTMKQGRATKWQQQSLSYMKDNVFTSDRQITIFSLPLTLWNCGRLGDVIANWDSLTQSNNDVLMSKMVLVNSK